MRLNRAGKIIAYDKVRGRKNAIRETVRTMNAHVRNGADYNGNRFICHSNCPDAALEPRAAVQAAFPHIEGKIRICDIGAIIASHCGPGTVAVFFLGDERPEERTACFIPRRRKIASAFAVLLCAKTPRLRSNAEVGSQSLFQIFICSECP